MSESELKKAANEWYEGSEWQSFPGANPRREAFVTGFLAGHAYAVETPEEDGP